MATATRRRERSVASSAARLDAQQYFGQNQVQYRHFKWYVIETEHFSIHYYPEEKASAVDVACTLMDLLPSICVYGPTVTLVTTFL